LKGRAYRHTFGNSSPQQNITNIYGKVSQQMTSAKQSGLLFDVARFSEKDAQERSKFAISFLIIALLLDLVIFFLVR
jgi:hypothetical protein